MDVDKLLDLANAFSQGSATGEDARESEQYTQLLEEFERGQGLDTTPVNWGKVKTLAIDVLSTLAKDLNAANFLCAALYFEDGFKGLAAGFSLLEKFVEADYWDTIFPPPKAMSALKSNKFRAACFLKPLKKLEKPFADFEVQLEQCEGIIACHKAFLSLDSALQQRFEDKAPNVFEFRNVLGSFARDAEYILKEQTQQQAQKEEPQQKTQSESEPPKQQTSATQSSSQHSSSQHSSSQQSAPVNLTAAPVAVASAADVEKALQANFSTAGKVAAVLREKNITDAYPYHLLRVNAWALIDKLPPDGVLPPLPNQDRIASLRLLEQNKNWQVLIQECEKSFAGGAIYWLGFHRFVAIALTELGAHEAAQAVINTVAMPVKTFS